MLIKGWLKAGVLEGGRYSESSLGAPQISAFQEQRLEMVLGTLQQVPSKKAMKKMRANIKEVFASPSGLLFSMEDMVQLLNPKIIGMRNYYIRRFLRPWLWKIEKYINYGG